MATTKSADSCVGAERFSGHEAIEYARAWGLSLAKHSDPTEGARDGLTPDEASEVAREDPSLIYVDVAPGSRAIRTYTQAGKHREVEIVVTPSGRHLRIAYRAVGQFHGTRAALMDGENEVASTRTVSLGHEAVARRLALQIAETL